MMDELSTGIYEINRPTTSLIEQLTLEAMNQKKLRSLLQNRRAAFQTISSSFYSLLMRRKRIEAL